MSAWTQQRTGLLNPVHLPRAGNSDAESVRPSAKLLTREQEFSIGRKIMSFRRAFQRQTLKEKSVLAFLLAKLLEYRNKQLRFDMLFDVPLKEMALREELAPKIEQVIELLQSIVERDEPFDWREIISQIEVLKIRGKYFEQAPFCGSKARELYCEYVANVHRMATANLRLVMSICQKLCHDVRLQQDLVQDGHRGLMMAVIKFDYRRGIRFSTYATPWIRKAILEVMPNQNRMIRVPDQFRSQLVRWLDDSHRGHANSTENDERRLSTLIGCNYLESVRLIRIHQDTQSLDRQTDGSHAHGLSNILIDGDTQPNDRAEIRESHQRLHSELEQLSERERTVVRFRFGLNDGLHRSLAEVGRKMKTSREQVRQLEKSALRKLAERLPADI